MVTKAVITVPAYFNDSQRQATKDAGKIAGLDVLRIINEPTAAALAYGIDMQNANEVILVYDLGGGTLDVSLLEVGEGVFEVLVTSGDTKLGGDDFDDRIVNWILQKFKEQEGIDIRKDAQAVQRITEAAEKAKIELSAAVTCQIALPFITAGRDGPKHISLVLSRKEFQDISSDLLVRCRKPVAQALELSRLTIEEVDEVLLVGGSTRIPAVQDLVEQMTGIGDIAERNYNMGVNPDEVVALGAAVQAGVLTGNFADIVLLDVTPLSLGLETVGGVMFTVISRNSTLPISKSQNFTTAIDGQTAVEINVLQGEREFCRDNKCLGTFRLEGIVPAPSGTPIISVSFDIDVNGILSVSAMDITSGKKADIKISGSSTLDKEEIKRMLQDSQKFSQADKQILEHVSAKISAKSLIYQTRELLLQKSGSVTQETKEEGEMCILAVQEAANRDDLCSLTISLERLRSYGSLLKLSLYSGRRF